jgi:hypothetical protein
LASSLDHFEEFGKNWRAEVKLLTEIQYVSDESGNPVSVIVPIELWHEIESEKETAYLLKSENMKRRLLEAKGRQTGIPFEEAREKLGI